MNSFFKGMSKGLLVIIVIGFVAYYISYNKWLNEGFDNLGYGFNASDLQNTGQETENIKIDYKAYYEKVNYRFIEENFGSEFYDMYYSNVPFSNDYYLFVTAINLISKEIKTNCSYSKEINTVEFEWKTKEIFGDITVDKKSFETKNKQLSITYNALTDTYLITTKSCSNQDYHSGVIYTTAFGYSTDNDNLYINEKAMYLNYSYDNTNNLIFNYHNGLTKEDPVIANDIDKVNLNLLNTYKLVFKKNNDSYIFLGIQK